MKTTLYVATTFAILLRTSAFAGPIDDIVSQFKSYGYQRVEIQQRGNTVKIEGVRGGVQREIVYDLTTSAIVRDETNPAGDGSNNPAGDPSNDGNGGDDHSGNDHENEHENDHGGDHQNDHENDHQNDHENDHENDNDND